jgi:hypothetical protein
VAKHHPNVWHLFDCFKKEEVCVRQKMLKMSMGAKTSINKNTRAFQQRLHSLESQFHEKKITIDELIHGLSLLVATKK